MPNVTPIDATIRPDGSAVLVIDGRNETVDTTRSEDARREIVLRAAAAARAAGEPIPVTVTEPDGSIRMIVDGSGSVTESEAPPAHALAAHAPSFGQHRDDGDDDDLDAPAAAPVAAPVSFDSPIAAGLAAPRTAAPTDAAGLDASALPTPVGAQGTPASGSERPTDDRLPAAAPVQQAPAPARTPGRDATAPSRTRERESFLKAEQTDKRATVGWRGAFAKMGLPVRPGARERAERDDVQAVSQHWPGPRTIAVVNGKGGAGKTPTTINLAAVFARYGGAGVLAWDNNQTRGTLGWRTEQGPHDATLLELLPQTTHLIGPDAQSADLARFVHHQTGDKYDVLRSKPAVLANRQRISAQDVADIHAVAAKYYRLIVIDSGNDETDPLWLEMIDHADQLVVATSTRDDHAEAGALLLEALAERDERSARLAADAVAVVTQADPKATDADIRHVADGFRQIARDVVSIPFDPALVDGVIAYDALRAETQRAWLAAAAMIARGL